MPKSCIASWVAPAAACVALFGISSCSRTDDPLERFASRTAPPGTGGAPHGGTPPSRAGAGSTSEAGGPATGGQSGSGGMSGAGAFAGQSGSGSSAGGPSSDFGCGAPPISAEPFSKLALRAAAADCAAYHYCRFEGAALELRDEVDTWTSAPSEQTRGMAQAAFAQAMSFWSVVELFQFGPVASSAEAAGKDAYQGQGLREQIHSWPLTARCRVEEQVILRKYASDMDGVLVSARGLFGLDYLLFSDESGTACSASSAVGSAWASMNAAELEERKLTYATALAQDISQRAGGIREAWSNASDARKAFVNARAPYPSEQEALKVMAWSLIYIEREVKDWKLGIPAGYTATSPVTLAEAPYSGLQIENVRANLRGFRGLFQGCGPDGEGLGFDDWLEAASHPELGVDIVRAWQHAQNVADQFPTLTSATPSELDELYRAVKALSDLLKNDLFGTGSALGLTLPQGVASDTD